MPSTAGGEGGGVLFILLFWCWKDQPCPDGEGEDESRREVPERFLLLGFFFHAYPC